MSESAKNVKRRLLDAWNKYKRDVIPPGASFNQVEETRRAFYGGAGTLFGLITGGMSDGTEAQPEDMKLLDDVDAEIKEFYADMERLAREQG